MEKKKPVASTGPVFAYAMGAKVKHRDYTEPMRVVGRIWSEKAAAVPHEQYDLQYWIEGQRYDPGKPLFYAWRPEIDIWTEA